MPYTIVCSRHPGIYLHRDILVATPFVGSRRFYSSIPLCNQSNLLAYAFVCGYITLVRNGVAYMPYAIVCSRHLGIYRHRDILVATPFLGSRRYNSSIPLCNQSCFLAYAFVWGYITLVRNGVGIYAICHCVQGTPWYIPTPRHFGCSTVPW